MKLDLNLLRVFDELMTLRSVGRAADRLGLTQSAVSHALRRLRGQLDDALFTRASGGLAPTPRARELAPAVRAALALIETAVAPAGFDPATTTRGFTICASPYFCATLLPIFVERARAAAPGLKLHIVPGVPTLFADIAEGGVDLALGGFTEIPSDLRGTPLYRERLVWAGRAGTDLDQLAGRPRLAFTRLRRFLTGDDRASRGGLDERIEVVPTGSLPDGPTPLTIHDPLSAIAFVGSSDLVTLIPRQLALRLTDRQNIALREADDQEPIMVQMLWHMRHAGDPAHLWLRGLMREAAATLA